MNATQVAQFIQECVDFREVGDVETWRVDPCADPRKAVTSIVMGGRRFLIVVEQMEDRR